MADPSLTFDERLHSLLQTLAEEGSRRAADGFSGMLGSVVTVPHTDVRLVPLTDIAVLLGGPEQEAVGIYLQADGEVAGHMMLVLPYLKALELADLLLGLPPGTSRQLNSLERSALAEVGNLTGTFFLNAVASRTGLSARPSPPAVVVDMLGAIIDIIVAASGGVSDQVLMFQSRFLREGRDVEADFWVIPDAATLQALAEAGSADGSGG